MVFLGSIQIFPVIAWITCFHHHTCIFIKNHSTHLVLNYKHLLKCLFKNIFSTEAIIRQILHHLFHYMRNFCNLIGLEQWHVKITKPLRVVV